MKSILRLQLYHCYTTLLIMWKEAVTEVPVTTVVEKVVSNLDKLIFIHYIVIKFIFMSLWPPFQNMQIYFEAQLSCSFTGRKQS